MAAEVGQWVQGLGWFFDADDVAAVANVSGADLHRVRLLRAGLLSALKHQGHQLQYATQQFAQFGSTGNLDAAFANLAEIYKRFGRARHKLVEEFRAAEARAKDLVPPCVDNSLAVRSPEPVQGRADQL